MKNFLGISTTVLIFLSLGLQSNGLNAQTDYALETNQFMHSVLDSFPNLAGLSVVVLKNNEVLFYESAGFANRSLRKQFTPETNLYIASNTKSFVGLAMARLINQGLISADDPLSDYIDPKYFSDSIDVSRIYIRDLPGHTHGLSNDAMTFRTAFTGTAPDSLLPHLLAYTSYRDHPPSKRFRYSNFSYLLSGMVIHEVTGLSWQKYLQDSILIPSGLTHTTPWISTLNEKNIAAAYVYNMPDFELEQKKDNTMHAAGGLVSTSTDMSHWLNLFINNGIVDGKAFIDLETIKLAKTVLVADTGRMGPFKRYGYTYGWLVGEFANESLYFHFGNYTGSGSMMSFMPEQKIGVFAFANEGKAGMYLSALVTTYVYNLLLQNENKEKIAGQIISLIKSEYKKLQMDSLEKVNPEWFPVKKEITLTSPSYGKLHLVPTSDSVRIVMGNLSSAVFEGDSTNHFRMELVSGDVEWFMLDQDEKSFTLQYEEYTTFYSQ